MSEKHRPIRDAFRILGKFLKHAIHLEWQTDAGRVNFYGMVLALLGVILLTIFGALEWIVGTIVAAVRSQSSPPVSDPIDVAWVFVVFTLGCVAMLVALDARARKHDRSVGSDHEGD